MISDESVLGASLDTRSGAYELLGSAEAAARRSADALAACVAQQLRTDLFVTNREYLHMAAWPLGRGVTYCRPRRSPGASKPSLNAPGTVCWTGTNGPADRPASSAPDYGVAEPPPTTSCSVNGAWQENRPPRYTLGARWRIVF